MVLWLGSDLVDSSIAPITQEIIAEKKNNRNLQAEKSFNNGNLFIPSAERGKVNE